MIGHLFELDDPRLDYALEEVSNYLGISITPSSPGGGERIFLAPAGGTDRGFPEGSVVIRLLPVRKKIELHYPGIEGHFPWKDLRIPYFNRTDAVLDGTAFLTDEKGDALITITRTGGRTEAVIGFDILNPIIYFLCGLEELGTDESDEFERFPHSSSTLFKENLMHTPVVTAYMDILGELVREVLTGLGKTFYRVWPWPQGHEFALGLSHDTDEIKRFTLKKSAHSMLKKDITGSLDTLKGSFKQLEDNDYWTYSKIIEMESRFDARSTFFFSGLTDKERSSRPRKEMMGRELAYTTGHPGIRKLYAEIAGKGWEVGLHSSFTANNDPERLKEEKENISGIIDKDVTGIRQHFLKFKLHDYFIALQEAGFRYDSSVGYSTHSGFRAGACYPYLFFDHRSMKGSGVLEIPLAIMEVTLSEEKTVNPTHIRKEAWRIIDVIKRFNGGSALLWHNNRYFNKEFKGWDKAYEQILRVSVENNGYLSSLEDMRKWMETRKGIVVKESGGVLKVSSSVPVSGVTIEIDPGPESVDDYGPAVPGVNVAKRKNGSFLLIIGEMNGKKGVTIPLP